MARSVYQIAKRLLVFAFRTSRQGIRLALTLINRDARLRAGIVRYFPAWLLLAFALVVVLPNVLASTVSAAWSAIGWAFAPHTAIAPLFTSEVKHWADDISRWAWQYNVDANLLATVMQIESCGHPTVSSASGAQGLFQVMPFHFDIGEDQYDPETNAKRGAEFLRQCLDWAEGDVGRAMACYNGGPSVLTTSSANWSDQTQRYFIWAIGIYEDARRNSASSPTLARWLEVGGRHLCDSAAGALGIE